MLLYNVLHYGLSSEHRNLLRCTEALHCIASRQWTIPLHNVTIPLSGGLSGRVTKMSVVGGCPLSGRPLSGGVRYLEVRYRGVLLYIKTPAIITIPIRFYWIFRI